MGAWKKRPLDASIGLKLTRSVWLVPRGNSPLGLPQAILDCEVSDEEINMLEGAVGHPIDREHFWVIDKQIPRKYLGKNLTEAEYYVDAHNKFKDIGAPRALGNEPADGGAQKPGNDDKPANGGGKAAGSGGKPAGSGAQEPGRCGAQELAGIGRQPAGSGGSGSCGEPPAAAPATSPCPNPAGGGATPANGGAMPANGAEDSIGASLPDRPAKKPTKETLGEIRVKLEEAFRRGHYDSEDVRLLPRSRVDE